MTNLAAFPDAEIELLGVLGPKFSSYRFCTSLPAQITQTTARIKRISGANRNIGWDRPIVDIDVFSPTGEADASTAGRAIQAALLSLAGTTTTNGVIQRVATINGPRWLPTDNQSIIRYGATYEVFIRAS